jgi:hypothetical protein
VQAAQRDDSQHGAGAEPAHQEPRIALAMPGDNRHFNSFPFRDDRVGGVPLRGRPDDNRA